MKKIMCAFLLALGFWAPFAEPQEPVTDSREEEPVTAFQEPETPIQEPVADSREEEPVIVFQESETAAPEPVAEPQEPVANNREEEPVTVVFQKSGTAAQEPGTEPQEPARGLFGGFSVTLDAIVDAFYMRSYSGDYAEKDPALSGSPFRYQGDGDISFFKSSAFDDLNARVKFDYSNETFGGLLQLRAESGTVMLGDWEAWLRLGRDSRLKLKVLAGNTGQRGQVEQYKNFDDFLKTRVDYFGILLPFWKMNPSYVMGNNFDAASAFPYGYGLPGDNYGYAELAGTDTSDLFMPAGSLSRQTIGFLLDLSYAPISISASLGGLFQGQSRPFKTPWATGSGTVLNDWDNIHDPVYSSGKNFAIRAEGAKILDTVTVALVYKHADSCLEKLTALNNDDTIEEKIGNHAFGLYVNITPPVPGLGISAGYSGLLKTLENPRYKDTDAKNTNNEDHYLSGLYKNTLFPYYSGVDLRIVYTGRKLSLTSSNNVSFARIFGTRDREENFVYGWAYSGRLNEADDGDSSTPYRVPFRSETYIGLYNALGLSCKISEALTAEIQVANQLASFTLQWEESPLNSITNSFGVYAGAAYKIYKKNNVEAGIRGGLDFKWNAYSYQDDSARKSVHHAGYMDIGVPIAIKVVF
jgi:hypothetical protein